MLNSIVYLLRLNNGRTCHVACAFFCTFSMSSLRSRASYGEKTRHMIETMWDDGVLVLSVGSQARWMFAGRAKDGDCVDVKNTDRHVGMSSPTNMCWMLTKWTHTHTCMTHTWMDGWMDVSIVLAVNRMDTHIHIHDTHMDGWMHLLCWMLTE